MRCLFAAAILALAPLPCFGQTADVAETEPRKRGFFSWVSDIFAPAQRNTGTAALIDAQQILREDNAREEAKEEAHWDAIRECFARQIGESTRSDSEAKLLIAKERGAAISASQSPTKGTKDSAENQAAHRQPAPDTTPQTLGESTGLGTLGQAKEKFAVSSTGDTPTAGDTLQQAAQNLAESVEEAFVGTPSKDGPKLSSMLLALVAIFLVPSAAVILVVLAVLSLRGGHRLQASVLGGAGSALGLLIVAAMLPPPDDSTLLSRLRAECERDAVRISGHIEETMEEGIVVDGVKGAEADEHGSAVILTDKRPARSGQEWKSPGYPVGQRSALNALGIMRPMPAYADNLETAVAVLAEAERARSEWWWNRAFRALQRNLGPDPQRLITLK